MQEINKSIEKMLQDLESVTVPQRDLSPEELVQFQAELRPIFLKTILETGKANLLKLKRVGSLTFHPDQLSRSTAQFSRQLIAAPSSHKNLPFQLFEGYITSFENLDLTTENWSSVLTNELPNIWSDSILTSAEDATPEEKEKIAADNALVVTYLLKGLNSVAIDTILDLAYKYYRYPDFVVKILYYAHAILNCLFFALIVIASIASIAFRVLSIGIQVVLALQNTVESTLLFALTANYYDEYIKQIALRKIAETYLDENVIDELNLDEFVKKYFIDAFESEIQKSNESNQQNGLPPLTASETTRIKRQLYSKFARNQGVQHFQYVIESIYFSLQRSLADDPSLKNLLLAFLRLCIAIPVVLGLSLPLTLASLSIYPLLAASVAVSFATILASILIKFLFAFVTSLPLYAYDATLWLTGQPAFISPAVQDKMTSDFLWGASFFSQAKTLAKKFVPQDVQAYFTPSLTLQ